LLHCKTTMKTLIRFALLTGLLATATAGCKSSYLLVTVEVPAHLQATSIRVVRAETATRSQWMKDDRLSTAATETGFVVYQVGIPTEAVGVTLVVQAMSADSLLAEASLEVTEAVGQTLRLRPCSNVLKREERFQSCLPMTGQSPVNAPGDAGPEIEAAGNRGAGGSGGTDVPVPDPVTSSPATCLEAQPQVGPPPTVAMPTPACERYCAAMELNCPKVYGSAARCQYACDLLGLQATGDPMQDTLACRTNFAEAATTTPTRNMYCPAAGAVTRACGDLCAMFCRAGARICPRSFPEETACRAGCEADRERFNQIFRDDPDAGASRDYYSVLWCRMQRLELAIFNRSYCDVAAPNNMCGILECARLNFTP
jgi:hypothetical protein